MPTGFEKLQQVIDDYAGSVRAAKTGGSPSPAEWAMKAAVAAFDQPLPTDSIMLSVARAIEAAANAATERERERCAEIAEHFGSDALNSQWPDDARQAGYYLAYDVSAAIRKGGDNV